MENQFKQHFEEVLRPLFPNHADIRECPSESELVFLVDWKLKNDAARPNKRSSQIDIRFCQDILEDYAQSGPDQRARIDSKIHRLLADRVSSFKPDHNVPGSQTPSETWTITTYDVNR